jgi:hypothetical protein
VPQLFFAISTQLASQAAPQQSGFFAQTQLMTFSSLHPGSVAASQQLLSTVPVPPMPAAPAPLELPPVAALPFPAPSPPLHAGVTTNAKPSSDKLANHEKFRFILPPERLVGELGAEAPGRAASRRSHAPKCGRFSAPFPIGAFRGRVRTTRASRDFALRLAECLLHVTLSKRE